MKSDEKAKLIPKNDDLFLSEIFFLPDDVINTYIIDIYVSQS